LKRPWAIDQAVRGGELAPLTRDQKTRLILLARDAWEQAGGAASGQDFTAWRYEQTEAACGRASLRVATQRDFRAIRGHFRGLLGRTRGAFRDAVAAATDDRGFVLAKLRHEIRAAEDVIEAGEAYVRRIARSRFKTGQLEALSSKELWSLVFDLRRNAQRRRKSGNV
jgi:hypothetical protein